MLGFRLQRGPKSGKSIHRSSAKWSFEIKSDKDKRKKLWR